MKTCNNCGTPATIPYIAHECEMDRLERINKRLFIVLVAVITMLVATNVAWIYYESQQEIVTEVIEEYEAETDGNGTAVINNIGSVEYNGSSKIQENS